MRDLEFLTGHVTFKLRYNQIKTENHPHHIITLIILKKFRAMVIILQKFTEQYFYSRVRNIKTGYLKRSQRYELANPLPIKIITLKNEGAYVSMVSYI